MISIQNLQKHALVGLYPLKNAVQKLFVNERVKRTMKAIHAGIITLNTQRRQARRGGRIAAALSLFE